MLFQRNDTVLFIGDSITDYNRARPVGEGLNNAWGTSYGRHGLQPAVRHVSGAVPAHDQHGHQRQPDP